MSCFSDINNNFIKSNYEDSLKFITSKIKQTDPKKVGFYLSGQMLNEDYYVANKLAKGFIGTANCDTNSRTCMASAVVGFYQTFGIDEPSGCYDDIEITDTIVTWGSNMAEMHPILWSRVTDRKLTDPDRVKVVNIQTYTHRTCDLGDINIIFKPQTDLAIWNYVAHEIVYIHPEAIDWDFVKKNIVFAASPVNIGYGMRNHTKDKSIAEGK